MRRVDHGASGEHCADAPRDRLDVVHRGDRLRVARRAHALASDRLGSSTMFARDHGIDSVSRCCVEAEQQHHAARQATIDDHAQRGGRRRRRTRILAAPRLCGELARGARLHCALARGLHWPSMGARYLTVWICVPLDGRTCDLASISALLLRTIRRSAARKARLRNWAIAGRRGSGRDGNGRRRPRDPFRRFGSAAPCARVPPQAKGEARKGGQRSRRIGRPGRGYESVLIPLPKARM
jgi:hypothetical protein